MSSSALDALQALSLKLGNTTSPEQESRQFIAWLEHLCAPSLVLLFVQYQDNPEFLYCLQGKPEKLAGATLPLGTSPWDWLTTQDVPFPEAAASQLALPLVTEGKLQGMLCLILPTAPDGDIATVLDIACTLLSSSLHNLARYHHIENLIAQRTAALRPSEERYRLISETISDFAYATSVDAQGRVHPEWITEAFFRLTGYTPQDLLMLDGWTPILAEEDRPRGLARRARIIEEGKSDRAEFRIRYKDGSLHWIRDYSRPIWDENEQRVVRVYGAAQNIDAERQAQAALERRAEETAALLATASAITSLDLEQVLHTIAQRAKTLFQADGSRIHLIEPDGKSLRCVIALHETAEAIMQMPVPMGAGFTGAVAVSGQARIVNDTEAEKTGLHIPKTPLESEAMMLAPLRRGETVLGVMTVSRVGTDKPFSAHDLEFLNAFAALAAIAIANAQLFEKRNRFATQMQAINNLGQQLFGIENPLEIYRYVCQALSALFPTVNEIEIALQERSSQPLERKYHWQPQAEDSTPQPVPLSDAHRQALTERKVVTPSPGVYYAPLVYGDRPSGVLKLSLRDEPHPDNHILIHVIASLLAAALENTHMFIELRHQLEHIRTLHMIERAITASVDLRVTLNIIIKQVRAHLKADLVAVFLAENVSQNFPCMALDGTTYAYRQNPQLNTAHPLLQKIILEQQMITTSAAQELSHVFQPSTWPLEEEIQEAAFVPLVAKGKTRGILTILYHHPRVQKSNEQDFLQTVARQTALSIEHISLFDQLQTATLQLSAAQEQMQIALLVEKHNGEPEGVTLEMAALGEQIAQKLNFPPEEIQPLRYGILLHDVGMLFLRDVQINKAAPLTDSERAAVREHPILGANFLSGTQIFHPVLDVIRYHHEYYNGTGYPRGLSGAQIPVAARIACLVDVWYALQSPRPYRPALSIHQALQIIREQSGKAFDPQIVAVLLKLIQQ
ncbi:MAG: hypothetical protein Fur0018_04310 [Anaerolineales bacterium]